jgi:hypothetical protein
MFLIKMMWVKKMQMSLLLEDDGACVQIWLTHIEINLYHLHMLVVKSDLESPRWVLIGD